MCFGEPVSDSFPITERVIETNGVRLHTVEAGESGAPVVVLAHGFPELAYSWRHQLKALADAGRWVIAPDQRGYGLTERPAPVEAYDMEHLTADLVALIDHLGARKAIWCGHDWGGAIVWQMPLRYPDRTAGVIGLNTPFQPRAPMDPIAIMRARLGEEMYIVHFQKPGEADAILGRDARKTMDFFMRAPLPEGAAPPDNAVAVLSDGGGAGMATKREAGAPSVFPLVRIVEAYDPANDRRPKFLTDQEFEVFADTFAHTGFTGGINWYRNFTRNWERSEGLPDRIEIPCLMVMAEKDAVLPPSSADGMEHAIPDLEKALIEGSGHWTQQERPAEVNRTLLDWLDRRFPRA